MALAIQLIAHLINKKTIKRVDRNFRESLGVEVRADGYPPHTDVHGFRTHEGVSQNPCKPQISSRQGRTPVDIHGATSPWGLMHAVSWRLRRHVARMEPATRSRYEVPAHRPSRSGHRKFGKVRQNWSETTTRNGALAVRLPPLCSLFRECRSGPYPEASWYSACAWHHQYSRYQKLPA